MTECGGRGKRDREREIGMESYVTERDIDAKTRQWVERIRPYNQHKMKLRAGKSALLVVDMQCFFLEKGSPTFTSGGLAILPTVRGLIRAFRRAGRPVIYTRHVHDRSGVDLGLMGWWWEGKCIEGSPQSE
ncbi:MAG: cysteine hydrolase, partial [Candidatus Eisenbacteria bacterium]|nr:cysteine hydrolase [Candidatus Eisenbacteria bacterium]